MGKVYHILLICDEKSDIDLIKTELSKLDVHVQIDTIQQEEQLIGRLEDTPPDLVISDYHMPALTGTDALQIVQDRYPQLPFILVAGFIGKEKANNIMLQGASDYAMKQNLERLGSAVLRELANYEEYKKKSRRLEKTNSQYENLLKSLNGIVWEADVETLEFLYVSPQSEQLLGYTPEEWLSEPNFWEDHIHPDDRREAIHFCQHKTRQGDDHTFEYRMLNADDEVVWVRDYVTVVTENGEPNRLHGLLVDISREKKAERQRDKAYEIADIGHWELDVKNGELFWSNTVKQLHEVDPDYEPELDTALAFYKQGEHRQKITTVVENTIATGASFEVELQIITAGDNEKWVRVVGETEFLNGECMRIYGSTQDITQRKTIEESLRESEEQYRNLFDLSPMPKWIYDAETLQFLDVNQQTIKKYGYSNDEFLSMTIKDIRPKEEIPKLEKALEQAVHTEGLHDSGIHQHQKKDGEIIQVEITGRMIPFDGKEARMVVADDVTDRLEAEEQLALSEQRFKSLVQDGSDLIAILDKQANYKYVAPTSETVLGIAAEEFIGNSALDYIHEDDQERVTNSLATIGPQEQTHIAPFRFRDSEGDWRWIKTIATNMLNNPVVEGLVANSRDVTESIEQEQELQESLERYEIVSKATSDTIWDWNLETDMIDYSQNIYNIFGYELQQVNEIEDWWRDKIHPDDRSEVLETIDKALRSSSERFQMEYRFQAADGRYKYIYDSAFIVEDQEGNPLRVIGAMRDVSEQKEAQRKMKKAFQERERILNRINEAFFAVDRNWNVTYWNNQAEEVIGVKRSDVLGTDFWETFPEAKERKFFKEYKRALNEQISVQFEEYYSPLEAWVEVHAYPSEEGLSVFFRDITERREAEQSLRDLYQKNRLVLESIDEGIYGIDTEGRCTFINNAAANMLGYRSEECIGKHMHELIHHQHANGEPYPESECPIFISKNNHESCRVTDEVFWRADGTCFNVEYTSNPMIEDGEITGGVVAFSDITERKQHEKELQQSLKEKETLLQEIHHRVKNNLAVVSGMMQMQVFEEEDENVRRKLSDGINRIQTMGNIHELLYQSESFSRIDADKNIRKLVTDVVNTFQIGVDLDIAFDLQKISLNINQAIPFSLIINEVTTNAMKHAFVNRTQGTLSVSLTEEDNMISIHIVDNGQGLPDNFENISTSNSLGLQLIKTLSAQLEAEYNYEPLEEGTLFAFTFEKADVKGIGNARLN